MEESNSGYKHGRVERKGAGEKHEDMGTGNMLWRPDSKGNPIQPLGKQTEAGGVIQSKEFA